jgi:hypothetical protein
MNTDYRNGFREIQREAYWSLPRIALGLLALTLVCYGLGFVATGGDLAIYRFWAPKMENAKREVFENTQSYVQGKTEYLSRLRFQYQNAQPGSAQQASLRSLIISEAALVDNAKLPGDLQAFVNQMKGTL